ncbi:MAG: acyltransferase [Candidatus Competibacter sp.]
MKIGRKISGTLMSANLIATVLVIAIHYGSNGAESGTMSYIFQEFITNGVARIAVPFFALISGYFTASALHEKSYVDLLFNKSKSLLVPFLFASVIVLLAYTGKKVFYENDSNLNFSIKWIFRSVALHPQSVQFWFLRDLMILTILSPILVGSVRNARLLILLGTGLLWLIDHQPFPIVAGWYLLNIETIFFFTLGGALWAKSNLLTLIINSNTKQVIVVLCLWFSLLIARIYIDPTLDVWYVKKYTIYTILLYKIAILFGVCALIQVSTFIHSNKRVIYLSGLTFFAYLYHLAPLSYFKLVTNVLISEDYRFYINFPMALILVFSTAHFLSQIQPKIFSYLTGGRNPNKALKRTQ